MSDAIERITFATCVCAAQEDRHETNCDSNCQILIAGCHCPDVVFIAPIAVIDSKLHFSSSKPFQIPNWSCYKLRALSIVKPRMCSV